MNESEIESEIEKFKEFHELGKFIIEGQHQTIEMLAADLAEAVGHLVRLTEFYGSKSVHGLMPIALQHQPEIVEAMAFITKHRNLGGMP